jgi:hypothetical protein
MPASQARRRIEAERLRKEAVAQNACIMLPPLVGAWTQLPT